MKPLAIAVAFAFAAGPALAIDFGRILDAGRQAVQSAQGKGSRFTVYWRLLRRRRGRSAIWHKLI